MSATKCPPAVCESPGLQWEKQYCTTKFFNFERDITETANSVRVRGVTINVPLKSDSDLWRSDKGEVSVVGAEIQT